MHAPQRCDKNSIAVCGRYHQPQMYQHRDVLFPVPGQFRYVLSRERRLPRFATRLGQQHCIHLSPALRVHCLRMFVAATFRLTKNADDSSAEGHSPSASRSVDRRREPNLICSSDGCCRSANADADLLTFAWRTHMNRYQSIVVLLALVAGVTADGCFAQSTNNQQESVAGGNVPQVATVTDPAVTTASPNAPGKTREQVMRELEDFQKSGQATQMLDLYRGGS